MRAKGQASVGGVGNARGVAGMYAAALSGLGDEPLLRAETITEFSTPHLTGPDLVTGGTAPENARLLQALFDAAVKIA